MISQLQYRKEFEILSSRTHYHHQRNEETTRRQHELEYIVRKNLLRLLASSKRTAYTRQLLKRFDVERHRLLNQSKNTASLHPRDRSKLRHERAYFTKLQIKEKLSIQLDKGITREPTDVTDGNVYESNENDKRNRLNEKSTKYNHRRLSLTVIEDEEASPVQKSNFVW